MTKTEQARTITARTLAAIWQPGERAYHAEDPGRVGVVVDVNVFGAGVVRVRFPGSVMCEAHMFFELESPDVTYGEQS